MDVRKLDDFFDGKIKPRAPIVAEPELGLGPLHTAYDNRGNAYTNAVPRQPDREVEHRKSGARLQGREVDPIIQKLDVHYQPGHNHSSQERLWIPTASGGLAQQVLEGPLPQRSARSNPRTIS